MTSDAQQTQPAPGDAPAPAAQTATSPADSLPKPFAQLIPGKTVYYWEPELNKGLMPCPALVVEAFRDSLGARTGHARLHVYYRDGADGHKPNVAPSDTPKADHWTWPMYPDGVPSA